jgi:peptidyl-prolyl cis-trans isomerase B (cyclophilin B)
VASSKDRQRKLERARQERRIARQAAAQRRRRQIQAGVGSVIALALIIVGTVWLLGGFESKPPAEPTVASGDCTWYLRKPAPEQYIDDTGHPPTSGMARGGTVPMSITTSLGSISASLDQGKSPCAVASMAYLAGKSYFDGTTCHRLNTTDGYLQCGDKSGTGSGGPSYTFDAEYVPTAAAAPTATPSASPSASASGSPTAAPSDSASPTTSPADGSLVTYARGTIAMTNNGALNGYGSQFIILYRDAALPPNFSVIGSVLSGLDLIDKVAREGTANQGQADGPPKTEFRISSLVISAPAAEAPTESPSPSLSLSASPTTTQP